MFVCFACDCLHLAIAYEWNGFNIDSSQAVYNIQAVVMR